MYQESSIPLHVPFLDGDSHIPGYFPCQHFRFTKILLILRSLLYVLITSTMLSQALWKTQSDGIFFCLLGELGPLLTNMV